MCQWSELGRSGIFLCHCSWNLSRRLLPLSSNHECVFDKNILSTLHRNLSSSIDSVYQLQCFHFVFSLTHSLEQGEQDWETLEMCGDLPQISPVLFLTTSLEGEHHKHEEPDIPDKPSHLLPLLVLTGTVSSALCIYRKEKTLRTLQDM